MPLTLTFHLTLTCREEFRIQQSFLNFRMNGKGKGKAKAKGARSSQRRRRAEGIRDCIPPQAFVTVAPMSRALEEIYQQLGRLCASRLPLPDAIKELSKSLRDGSSRKLVDAMDAVGDQTASGEAFSDAIDAQAKIFPAFHRRLIRAGETGGCLSEALLETARQARMHRETNALIRGALLLPFFSLAFAFGLLSFVASFLIPAFRAMVFDIYGEGSALPTLTEWIFRLRHFDLVFLVLCILCTFLGLISLLGGRRVRSLMLWLQGKVPGSQKIGRNIDMACLCGMLATFLRGRSSLPESLKLSADMMQVHHARDRLFSIAENIESGISPSEAFKGHKEIDPLLPLLFAHTPVEALASELEELSILFQVRVEAGQKHLFAAWKIFLFVVLLLLSLIVVLSVLAPLLNMFYWF